MPKADQVQRSKKVPYSITPSTCERAKGNSHQEAIQPGALQYPWVNSSLEIFPRKSQPYARLSAYQAEHGPQMKKNDVKLCFGHAVAHELILMILAICPRKLRGSLQGADRLWTGGLGG